MAKTKEDASKFQMAEDYSGIVFHGASFKNYYRPHSIEVRQGKGNHKKKKIKIYRSSIPCWVKLLFLIDSFNRYLPHNQAPYFVSNSAILETLNGYGNTYVKRTIEKAVAKLEQEGFINLLPYPASEEELKVNPKNKHLHRRKLLPDIDKINTYISIFDEEDPLFKELPDRSPIKKIVRQRPYSYIGENQEVIEAKFNEYTADENGVLRRKPYKNSKELFTFWCMTVSSKYYNADSLTKKFIPTNLDNQQEVVDKASISKASSKGILDIHMIRTYQENLDALTDAEASNLVGWKAPPNDPPSIRVLHNMGYEVDSKGFIKSFKRLKKKEATQSCLVKQKAVERQKTVLQSPSTENILNSPDFIEFSKEQETSNPLLKIWDEEDEDDDYYGNDYYDEDEE